MPAVVEDPDTTRPYIRVVVDWVEERLLERTARITATWHLEPERFPEVAVVLVADKTQKHRDAAVRASW